MESEKRDLRVPFLIGESEETFNSVVIGGLTGLNLLHEGVSVILLKLLTCDFLLFS